MQYFKNSTGEHEHFMNLCNRVKYFKESKEGVSEMCQLVEDYAKEYNKNSDIQKIVILFKNGGTMDLALKMFSNFSVEEIEKNTKRIIEQIIRPDVHTSGSNYSYGLTHPYSRSI